MQVQARTVRTRGQLSGAWSPLCALLVLTSVSRATPPPEQFYVDVRDYLPKGHVTDGSVDYKQQIQKCFDENLPVFFPGSDDPQKPMIYGSTAGLKTRPHARIRFGPNAILRRLPSFGQLLNAFPGTHLVGVVIDGNKYAHWPLVKDREGKIVGAALAMRGWHLVKDCFVYNNAGIAYGLHWYLSDCKLYRCRAENLGFLEALGDPVWQNELASGDGFLFQRHANYNIVKDSEAIDSARWGFVVTADSSHNTLVDCRGGDLHFRCFGFIDVEGAGPGNSLVRCRSPNSQLIVQDYHQDVVGCAASAIDAESALYPRLLGCTTAGGVLRACAVQEDRFVTFGRQSLMLGFNRVFLSGASPDHSLSLICLDGLGLAVDNVVYGFDDGKERSTEALLYGVRVRDGTQQTWGQWKKQLDQFAKPYYLRAHFDFQDFKRSKP